MGKIFAVANQKGGVGKTTTTINLGAALAAFERKVLIVDCDPQGNASRGLGVDPTPPHLYHALTGDLPLPKILRASGFPNLDLAPAGRDLVGVEVEFVHEPSWEQRLKSSLAYVREAYDFILLDCPPSLGHLTVSALSAADGVLVPLQCEYFALEGISELVATVRRIQGGFNPSLELSAIILTMYDDRTNLAKDVVDEARRHFAGRVMETIIPRNIRLAEAPSHGQSVIEYDIKCRGSQAYLDLGRELLGRVASGSPAGRGHGIVAAGDTR